MMIAGTVMMERAERQTTGAPGQGIWKLMGGVARNLVRNPLVIGLAFGALFHLLGQPLGGPVKIVVDQLAGVAAPAALVSIGMALDKYGLAGNTGLAAVTSTLKLLVLPGAVFAACHLLGLNDSWTAALVLTSSVPTGVNAWLIANHFNVGHALASSTITLTTALGVVSVSVWAYLLM